MDKVKTDREIVSYIANKIWHYTTNTEEDIRDCIQEALNLKAKQYPQLDKCGEAHTHRTKKEGCGKWLRESEDYGWLNCGQKYVIKDDDSGYEEGVDYCKDCKKDNVNSHQSVRMERQAQHKDDLVHSQEQKVQVVNPDGESRRGICRRCKMFARDHYGEKMFCYGNSDSQETFISYKWGNQK